MVLLKEEFAKYHFISKDGEGFLNELEFTIDQDLWKSAGGNWSESSVESFKTTAMQKLAENLKGDFLQDYQTAWIEVIRSFHQNYWQQKPIPKAEKKPQTEEQKTFWELFSYLWILFQTTFITKTVIFYFGITSAQEDSDEGKIYAVLAFIFTLVSLTVFAVRKSRKKQE